MFGLFKKKVSDQEVFEMCLGSLMVNVGPERAQKEANQIAIFIWLGIQRMLAEGIPASHFANIAKAEAQKIMSIQNASDDDFINSARNNISWTFFKSIAPDVDKKYRQANFIKILEYLRLLAKPEIVRKIYELLKLDWPEQVNESLNSETTNDSVQILLPDFVNNISVCEDCGFLNKQYYFKILGVKKGVGLSEFSCPSCGSEKIIQGLLGNLNGEVIQKINEQSVAAYKKYYPDYERQCHVFNNLQPKQTFDVLNKSNLAINWLVKKYGRINKIVSMPEEQFVALLNDLNQTHNKNQLDTIAIFFIKTTLCFWRYCPCIDLDVIDDNWAAVIDSEGCDVEDSKISFDLYKVKELSPAEKWPFPKGSRP